ncbi:hypothetical protein [Aquimarina algicola]|uniref:Uncharacterized protein n=1 Tax=Aquimarina algicola TaxID=2589995 RepID=A0A504J822_9FLAO|nr:hypothetical protein [Aquimarina algicola]TPN86987.1 hypothetical protein FHK87_05175 [Aquimarina algicola]
MEEAPQIRRSIHKPYRYDNTIHGHAENLEMVFFIMTPLLIGVIIMRSAIGPWSLLIFGVSVIVGSILLFKLYNIFFHRYYRIVKRKNDDKSVYYIIQSYVSSKKLEKIVQKKNIKWVDVESYYSSNGENPSEREKAERFFDQKTIKNDVDEIVISEIKKSIYKPKFLHKLLENNNLHIKEIVMPGILLGIVFIFVFFKSLLFFMGSPLGPIKAFSILGVIILGILAVCILYIRKNNRYLRLIERKESQGRYQNTSYYIQSFISRKRLEKIKEKKNIKWKSYKKYGVDQELSRKDAKYYFHQYTTEKKIIDEVL